MSDNFTDLASGAEIIKHFRTLSVEFQSYLLGKLTEENERMGKDPFTGVKARYLSGDLKGRKIEAIKAVRELAQRTNRMEHYHLKEAKDLVESW